MSKPKSITVKTGTAMEFMDNVKKIMRTADKGEPIQSSCTLIFEEPLEMLHFLSEAKIKLIHTIRNQPDSVTNIAKATHRNRAAVYRDITEMERFGLVKTHDEINPGHGRHKIVEVVAAKLRLEAHI